MIPIRGTGTETGGRVEVFDELGPLPPITGGELVLTGATRRGADGEGLRVPVGEVDFNGWFVHPLGPADDGHDAYLVKVGYDLRIHPDTPPPAWVEVGFAVPEPGVGVRDALPYQVAEAQGPRRYALTRQLDFAEDTGDGDRRAVIAVPPYTPRITVFGVGGADVTWRHVALPDAAGVPPGSHVGWLVLLVPRSCHQLGVTATGSLSLPARDMGLLVPERTSARFTVRLPATRGVAEPDSGSGVQFRLGFTVDVVGYGSRTELQQDRIQRRLRELLHAAAGDAGITLDPAFVQPAGDGVNVFLDPGVDLGRVPGALLTAIRDRLAAGNAREEDRMRLRMAVDIGPVRRSALGFSGDAVISFGRLVDSEPIRRAMRDHPDCDLALLVSDLFHRSVVRQGYAGFDPARFQRHTVVVKEYQADAWLCLVS